MTTISADPKTLQRPADEKNKNIIKSVGVIVRYLLLSLVGLAVFTPFILAFLGSFKTGAEIIAFPPTLFPEKWMVGNWPDLFNTDLGGSPRLEGTTSIGLIVGLFAFYATFFLTAMSNQQEGKGLPRKIGLPISILLVGLTGYWRFCLSGEFFRCQSGIAGLNCRSLNVSHAHCSGHHRYV